MRSVFFFCGLLCLCLAQQQALTGPEDDGSYNADKYEAPYKHTEQEDYQDGPQQLQYQPQQQYQPQSQYQPQQQYQPQPQQYYQQQAPRAPAPAYQSQYQGQPQQYVTDSKNAAILSEQRYLNGDGKFGASYTQDDNVQFKEESDSDGTRRGSYSYVSPNGQRMTVTYTAGKDGFQAFGDHLPGGPAPQQAAPSYQPQPESYQQPAYQPQPEYQPRASQQAHPNSLSNGQYSLDSRF